MQLAAFGAQDAFLTSNPSVTFFTALYRRHSAFASEVIEQITNGSATNSGRISVTVARNGDLIGPMYFEFRTKAGLVTTSAYDPTNATKSMEWVAERAIAEVELTIGGQRIDRHVQRWWRLYSELFYEPAKKATYGKMTSASVAGSHVYLPMLFFFNRHVGLSLSLISLQFHEVRIDATLSSEFLDYFDPSVVRVWGEYYFLEAAERKALATRSSELLVETVQFTGVETLAAAGNNTNKGTFRLSFNHPVKELIWCVSRSDNSQNVNLWDFTDTIGAAATDAANVPVITTHPPAVTGTTLADLNSSMAGCPTGVLSTATGSIWVEGAAASANNNAGVPGIAVGAMAEFSLKLNGSDRFKPQPGKFFNTVLPFKHHSGSPYPGIYCWSAALTPETLQPSGSLNFSRVDSAQVEVSTVGQHSKFLSMFAVSVNVLRISSGMAGLAFSN